MNINYSQSNLSFTKLKSVSSSTSTLKNPHNQHMSSSLENITTFSAFTFPKNQGNITQPIYQKQKSNQLLLTAPSVTLSTPVTPFHPSSDIDSKLKNTVLQNDRIQFDIKLEQKRKSRLEMDNKHLQSKIQNLQERKKILNESRDNILNKQNTLHYESEIQHGELDQQISHLRNQQQSLIKSKSDLETKHSNYVKTKKDYEDVINELQQTIHILKSKEHNEESLNISEINKQIYKQTKWINKLLKQQKEEKEKNEEMKKKIDELKQELNKINHKENRVKKFDDKIKCYEKLIGKLEKLNAKKENDLNKIESEKEYLGNKMDLVKIYSKDSYQRELLRKENLQNELRRRTEEIEEMISENVKLKNDLEELFHKYKNNPSIIRQRIQLLKEDNKWKLKKKYMQELSKKKFEEDRTIKQQQQQQRIIINKPIEKKGNDKNVENTFPNQQQNNGNHFYRRIDNSEVMKASGKKHKKKPFVIRDINNEHRNELPGQENKPHDYKDNQLVLPYEYPTVKYMIIQATNNDVINNQMDIVDSISQQNKHEFIISEDLSKIVLTTEPNIDSNEHLEIDKKQISNFDIQTYPTNNNIHEHFKNSPQLFGNEELIIPKNIERFNNQFITDKHKQDQPHAIRSSLNFPPVEKIQGFKELLDKHANNLNNNNQIENAYLDSLETSPILQDQLDNESNNEIYKEPSHREINNQNLNILNKQNQPQINSENDILEGTPDKQEINDLQKMNLETQFDNLFYDDINKKHNQKEELKNNVIYNDKNVPLPKEDTLINEQPGVNEITSKEEDMPHHPQKFRYINKKPFTKDKNYKNESIPEKISENDSEIDEDAYNLPFSGDSAKWIHQSPKIIKKETNKNLKKDKLKKEKNTINIESNKIPSNKYRNPKNESFVPYKPENEIVSGTSQIKKGDNKSKEFDDSNPLSKEEKPIETKKVNQNNEKFNPNNEQKQQSSISIKAENINLPRKITDVEDKLKHPYQDIIEPNYERIKESTKPETDNNIKDISINEQPQVTKDDNNQLFNQHYKNNISQKQNEKIILPQGKDDKKSTVVNPKTKIPSNRKVNKDHPSKAFPQNFITKHVEPVTSIDLQYNKHEELYEISNENNSQKQIDNKQTKIIEDKEKLPIKYHKEETKKLQNESNKEDNVSPQEKSPILTTQDLKTIKDTNTSPKITNIIYNNNYPQSQLEVKPNQSYQPLITDAKEKPIQIMKKKYPFNIFPKPNNNNINQKSYKNISLLKEEALSTKEQPFSNKSINDIPVYKEPQHLQNVNKQKPTEIKNVQSFNSEQEVMIPENIKPKYDLQKNKNTRQIFPENILNENNNFKENNNRPNKENQNEIYNSTTYADPQANIIETQPPKGVDKEGLQTLQEKDKPTVPKESQLENTFNKQNNPNLINNKLIHPNKPSTNKELLQNKDNQMKQTNILIQQENIPQSNQEIIKSPLTPKDAINKQFKPKSNEIEIQQKENDFTKPINNKETNNNFEFPISKNNKDEDKFRDSIISEEKFKEKELLKKKSIPKGNLQEENNKKYIPNGKLKEDIPDDQNFSENLKDLIQPQEQKIISHNEFTDKPNISKDKEYSNIHINKDHINNNELILPNEMNKEENILLNNKKPINEENIKDSLIIGENKPKAKNYVTKKDIENNTITNIPNAGSDALKIKKNNNNSDTLEFKSPFTPENLIDENELVIKDFPNLNEKNTNEIIDKDYPINKPISKEKLQPKEILNQNQPKKISELLTTTNQPKENKPVQNFPHNNISELEKRNRNKEYQPINEHNPNDIFTPQISNDKMKSPFESNFMNEKTQKHMIPIIKETSELNDKTHDSLLPYEEKILKDQSSKKFPQKIEDDKQKYIVIPEKINDKPIKELSIQEKTLSSNSPKEIKSKDNKIKEKLIKLAPTENKTISNEEISKLNSDKKKESLDNLDGEAKIHPEDLNNKENENKGNSILDNSKISQNQQEIKYNKIPEEQKSKLNENNLENIVNNTPQIQQQTNQNYNEEKQISIDNEDKRINNASKKQHLPIYKTTNTDDISNDISSNPLIPKNQSTKVNEPLPNYTQYQQDYEKAIELNKTKESVQLSEQNKFNSKANDTKKLPEIINKEHKPLIHNETQFNQEENKNDKMGDTKLLLSNITQIENELKNIPIKKENKDITSSKFENIPKGNNQLYEQTKNPILNKLEDQNQDFNKQTKEQNLNEPITNNFSLRLVESPKYTQNEPIQKEIPQFIEDTLKSIYETNKEDMFTENEIPKSSDIQIKEDNNKSKEPNHNVFPSLSEDKLHINKIKNEPSTKEVPCFVEDKLKNIIKFYESNQKEEKQIQQDIHTPNKEILSNINSKDKSPKSDLKNLPTKIETTLKAVFNQYEGEENNKPKQISPGLENNLKEIVNKYEPKTKMDINNNENSNLNRNNSKNIINKLEEFEESIKSKISPSIENNLKHIVSNYDEKKFIKPIQENIIPSQNDDLKEIENQCISKQDDVIPITKLGNKEDGTRQVINPEEIKKGSNHPIDKNIDIIDKDNNILTLEDTLKQITSLKEDNINIKKDGSNYQLSSHQDKKLDELKTNNQIPLNETIYPKEQVNRWDEIPLQKEVSNIQNNNENLSDKNQDKITTQIPEKNKKNQMLNQNENTRPLEPQYQNNTIFKKELNVSLLHEPKETRTNITKDIEYNKETPKEQAKPEENNKSIKLKQAPTQLPKENDIIIPSTNETTKEIPQSEMLINDKVSVKDNYDKPFVSKESFELNEQEKSKKEKSNIIPQIPDESSKQNTIGKLEKQEISVLQNKDLTSEEPEKRTQSPTNDNCKNEPLRIEMPSSKEKIINNKLISPTQEEKKPSTIKNIPQEEGTKIIFPITKKDLIEKPFQEEDNKQKDFKTIENLKQNKKEKFNNVGDNSKNIEQIQESSIPKNIQQETDKNKNVLSQIVPIEENLIHKENEILPHKEDDINKKKENKNLLISTNQLDESESTNKKDVLLKQDNSIEQIHFKKTEPNEPDNQTPENKTITKEDIIKTPLIISNESIKESKQVQKNPFDQNETENIEQFSKEQIPIINNITIPKKEKKQFDVVETLPSNKETIQESLIDDGQNKEKQNQLTKEDSISSTKLPDNLDQEFNNKKNKFFEYLVNKVKDSGKITEPTIKEFPQKEENNKDNIIPQENVQYIDTISIVRQKGIENKESLNSPVIYEENAIQSKEKLIPFDEDKTQEISKNKEIKSEVDNSKSDNLPRKINENANTINEITNEENIPLTNKEPMDNLITNQITKKFEQTQDNLIDNNIDKVPSQNDKKIDEISTNNNSSIIPVKESILPQSKSISLKDKEPIKKLESNNKEDKLSLKENDLNIDTPHPKTKSNQNFNGKQNEIQLPSDKETELNNIKHKYHIPLIKDSIQETPEDKEDILQSNDIIPKENEFNNNERNLHKDILHPPKFSKINDKEEIINSQEIDKKLTIIPKEVNMEDLDLNKKTEKESTKEQDVISPKDKFKGLSKDDNEYNENVSINFPKQITSKNKDKIKSPTLSKKYTINTSNQNGKENNLPLGETKEVENNKQIIKKDDALIKKDLPLQIPQLIRNDKSNMNKVVTPETNNALTNNDINKMTIDENVMNKTTEFIEPNKELNIKETIAKTIPEQQIKNKNEIDSQNPGLRTNDILNNPMEKKEENTFLIGEHKNCSLEKENNNKEIQVKNNVPSIKQKEDVEPELKEGFEKLKEISKQPTKTTAKLETDNIPKLFDKENKIILIPKKINEKDILVKEKVAEIINNNVHENIPNEGNEIKELQKRDNFVEPTTIKDLSQCKANKDKPIQSKSVTDKLKENNLKDASIKAKTQTEPYKTNSNDVYEPESKTKEEITGKEPQILPKSNTNDNSSLHNNGLKNNDDLVIPLKAKDKINTKDTRVIPIIEDKETLPVDKDKRNMDKTTNNKTQLQYEQQLNQFATTENKSTAPSTDKPLSKQSQQTTNKDNNLNSPLHKTKIDSICEDEPNIFKPSNKEKLNSKELSSKGKQIHATNKGPNVQNENPLFNNENIFIDKNGSHPITQKDLVTLNLKDDPNNIQNIPKPNILSMDKNMEPILTEKLTDSERGKKEHCFSHLDKQKVLPKEIINELLDKMKTDFEMKSFPNNNAIQCSDTIAPCYRDSENQFNEIDEPKSHKQNDMMFNNNKEKDNSINNKQIRATTIPVLKEKEKDFVPETPVNHTIIKESIKQNKIEDKNSQPNDKSNELLIPQENETTNNQNQPNLSKQSISETSLPHDKTEENKAQIIPINIKIKDKNDLLTSLKVEQTNQPNNEEIINNKGVDKDIEKPENKQIISNETKESVNPRESRETFTEPLTSKTNQKELDILNQDKPISNEEINKLLDSSEKDKDLFKGQNKDKPFVPNPLLTNESKDISQGNNVEEPLNTKPTMNEIIPNNNETIPKEMKRIGKFENSGKEKLFLQESENPTQFIKPDNTQKVAFQPTEVQKENLNTISNSDILKKELPEELPLIETNQQDKISAQEQIKEIYPIKDSKVHQSNKLPLLQKDEEIIDSKDNITTLSPKEEKKHNENKLPQDKVRFNEDYNKLNFPLQQDNTFSNKQYQINELLPQDKIQTNKNMLLPDNEESKMDSKLNNGDTILNEQGIPPSRIDEKITSDKEEMKKEKVLSPKTELPLDIQDISVPKETNIEKEQVKEILLKSQGNKDNKDSTIVEQKQLAKQDDSQLDNNKDITNNITNKNNNTEQKENESIADKKLNYVNTPQNIIDNNEKNLQRTQLNQQIYPIELLIDEKDKSDNKQPIFTNKNENNNQINEPLTHEIIEQKDNSQVNKIKKESDKLPTENPKVQEHQIINTSFPQKSKKENMLKETFIPEQIELKQKRISPIDKINNLKERDFPTNKEIDSHIILKSEDVINNDKEIQQQINPKENTSSEHILGNNDILTHEINNKENEPTIKDNSTIENDISKDNLILESTRKELMESIQITKQTDAESKDLINQINLNKEDSVIETTQTNTDILKDSFNTFKNQTQINQNDLPITTKPEEPLTDNIFEFPFNQVNPKETIEGKQKEINKSINSSILEETIEKPNNKVNEIIQLNSITKDNKGKDDNIITTKQLKENEGTTVNEQMTPCSIDKGFSKEKDVQQKPKINLIDNKELNHENNIPYREKSKEDFIDQELPLVISPGKDKKNIVNENELKDSFIPKEETKEPISTIENINHNKLKDDFIPSETIKNDEINQNETPSDNVTKPHHLQSQENSKFGKPLSGETIELKSKDQIPESSFIQQTPSNTNIKQTNTFSDEKESKSILSFTEKEKETIIPKSEKTEQQLQEEEQDTSNNRQIEPKILESNKNSSSKKPSNPKNISIIPENIFKDKPEEKATLIPEKPKSDIITNHKDMIINPKVEEIILMDKNDRISSRKDNKKYQTKENESINIKSEENILDTNNEEKPKEPMTTEELNMLNKPLKPETNKDNNNNQIIQDNLSTVKKSQEPLIPKEIIKDNKLIPQKHFHSNEIPVISNNIEENRKPLKENIQITQPNDSKIIENRKQINEPSDITNQYKNNDDINNLINPDNKIKAKECTYIDESSNPYETRYENNPITEPAISSKQNENEIKEKVDNSELPLLTNDKKEQNKFPKESSSFREKEDLTLNNILNLKEEENKTPLVLTETQQLLNSIEKIITDKENLIEPPFIRNQEDKIINQSNLNKENPSNELTSIEKPKKSIKPTKSKDKTTPTENKLKESLIDSKEKLETTFNNEKQKENTNNSQEQISNKNKTLPISGTQKQTIIPLQTNIPKGNENNLNIIPINKKHIENENYKELTKKDVVNKELSSPQKEDQQNLYEDVNKDNEIKRKDKTELQIDEGNIPDESSTEINPTIYLNKEFPLKDIKDESNFNDKTNESGISKSNEKDKETAFIFKPTTYPSECNIKQANQEHKLSTKNIQSPKGEKSKEIIPQKEDNKKHLHSMDNNIPLNENGIKETIITEELNKNKDFPRITNSEKDREEILTNIPKGSSTIISQNQKHELNLPDYPNLKTTERQNQTFQDKYLITNDTSEKEPFKASNIHQKEITIEPHHNGIELKEGTEIKDTSISNQNHPLIAGVPSFVQEKLKEIVRKTESDKKEDSISLSRKYEEIPSNQKQTETPLIAENKLDDIPNQNEHIKDDKPFNKKFSPSFINKFEDVINQYEHSNENKIKLPLEDSKTKEASIQEKQTMEPLEKEIPKKNEDKVQKTMNKHKPSKENQQIKHNVSPVIKDKIIDIVEQYSGKEITNSNNPNEFLNTSKPEKTTQIHLDNETKKPLISLENISKDEPINTIDDKKGNSKVDSTNSTPDSKKKTQGKEKIIPIERLPTKELSPHLTSEENKKQSIEPLNKKNLLLKDKSQQKKESFIKEETPINIKTSVDNIKSKQNDLKEMPKSKSKIKSDKRDSNRQNEKPNECLIPQENKIINNKNQPNVSKQSISKTSSHDEIDENKEQIIHINKEIKDKNAHSAPSNVNKLSEQTNQPIHEEILNNKNAEKDIEQLENKQFIPTETKESVNPHEIQEKFTEPLTSTTNQKELNILNQDKPILNAEINKLLDSSEKDKDLFKEKNKDEPFVSNTLLTDKPKDISQGNNAEEPLYSKFTMNETIPNNNETIPKIVQRNEDQIYDTNEIINPSMAEIEKETIHTNDPKKEIRNQETRKKEEHELLFEKPENEILQKNARDNSKDYLSHKDDKQNDTVLNDKNEKDINFVEKGKQVSSNENPQEEEIEINNKPPKLTTDILKKPITTSQLNDEKLMTQQNKPIPEEGSKKLESPRELNKEDEKKTGEIRNTETKIKDSFNLGTISEDKEPKNLYQSLDQQIENISSEKIIANPQSQIDNITNIIEVKDNLNIERYNIYKDTIIPENIKKKDNSPEIGLLNPEIKPSQNEKTLKENEIIERNPITHEITEQTLQEKYKDNIISLQETKDFPILDDNKIWRQPNYKGPELTELNQLKESKITDKQAIKPSSTSNEIVKNEQSIKENELFNKEYKPTHGNQTVSKIEDLSKEIPEHHLTNQEKISETDLFPKEKNKAKINNEGDNIENKTTNQKVFDNLEKNEMNNPQQTNDNVSDIPKEEKELSPNKSEKQMNDQERNNQDDNINIKDNTSTLEDKLHSLRIENDNNHELKNISSSNTNMIKHKNTLTDNNENISIINKINENEDLVNQDNIQQTNQNQPNYNEEDFVQLENEKESEQQPSNKEFLNNEIYQQLNNFTPEQKGLDRQLSTQDNKQRQNTFNIEEFFPFSEFNYPYKKETIDDGNDEDKNIRSQKQNKNIKSQIRKSKDKYIEPKNQDQLQKRQIPSKTKTLQVGLFNIQKNSLFKIDITTFKKSKVLNTKNITNIIPKIDVPYILLNILRGTFIFIQKKLYFYSPIKNTISFLANLTDFHINGSILLIQTKKEIVFISGKDTSNVETYSIKNKTISILPQISQPREYCCSCLINEKIYLFMGINPTTQEEINTIEYIDINKGNKWDVWQHTMPFNFLGMNCFHSKRNEIIFVGGHSLSGEILKMLFLFDLTNGSGMVVKYFDDLEGGLSFEHQKGYNIYLNSENKYSIIMIDDNNKLFSFNSTENCFIYNFD